ncbi:MAG: VanZ family protein [Bacteroidaceae bacterium]|nr:VanZ family protein [Bacteroidaceae bacterium]
MIKNILKRYPFSLVIIVAIIYLSLFKPPTDNIPTIPYWDKIVHFLMYAGFCVVLWFEYLRSHPRINRIKMVLGAIVAPILFGGAMEIAQVLFTGHRSGDRYDFLFNTLGVLCALLFSIYVTRPFIDKYHLHKKENTKQ